MELNRVYNCRAVQLVLYSVLEFILIDIKGLCITESDRIKKFFIQYGFHPAICIHPSIIYGGKKEPYAKDAIKKRINILLRFKIVYLRKAIHAGLLQSDKGHWIMQQLDIPSYYGNGLEFWFEEWHTPLVQYTIPESNVSCKRIAIYTALTGDYDNVNELLYKETDIDYFLFTNNERLQSKTWQVVYVKSDLDNVLLCREIKMLPHKYLGEKYDASIYIDANAVIYGELSQLINYLNNNVSFAVTKHSARDSVRDEIDAIIQMKKMNYGVTMAQYNRYLTDGFMDNIGLAECGILVRRHNEIELRCVMEAWWKEFQNGIRRDQISLLPVIQRMNYQTWKYMNGSIWHNQYCKIISHK